MKTLRDVLSLEWLYPCNLPRQEITNRLHFTLLKIFFVWLLFLTAICISYLFMRDEVVTRRALIDEQYEKDHAAYIIRVKEYEARFNSEKQPNITKERKTNGTDKKR
jgi:hypothetical protein